MFHWFYFFLFLHIHIASPHHTHHTKNKKIKKLNQKSKRQFIQNNPSSNEKSNPNFKNACPKKPKQICTYSHTRFNHPHHQSSTLSSTIDWIWDINTFTHKHIQNTSHLHVHIYLLYMNDQTTHAKIPIKKTHMQNSNEIESKKCLSCRDHACVAYKNCIEMFTDALLAVNRRRYHCTTKGRKRSHRTHE